VPDEAETAWVNPVDSVADLPLIMNEQVPNAARVLALYTLGRAYRQERDLARALAAYEKALTLKPSDRATAAALHFYVGTLLPQVRGITVDNISTAIDELTAAQALAPGWENVLYNRGTAYLGRALLSLEEDADLAAAIADLSVVIAQQPTRIDPLLNRGIAYYQRNDEGDAAKAIDDFTRAIELDPIDHRSYYHRGLARIRNNDTVTWRQDLDKAHMLAPGDASVLNGLCWGHGVFGEATTALAYCDQAVERDPTGSSLDSRAIAYAQVGRYADAAADLTNYLAWVNATYPDLYAKYRGVQVEEWIAALQSGNNPFDAATRERLRQG
jgi:tetratricopeptide (TPR) repeat protein